MLFANVCAGFSFFWYGVGGKGGFWAFWLLLGALCIFEVLALLVIPLVCTKLGSQRCASALWAEFGGSIIFVTPWEFAGQHNILPVKFVMGSLVFMVSSCIC